MSFESIVLLRPGSAWLADEIGPLPVIGNLLLILLFSSAISFLLEHASRRSSTYTWI
jgi:hypothetical protein